MTKLEKFITFLIVTYAVLCGRLIYVCAFHWNQIDLYEYRAVWIANVLVGFVLVLLQSARSAGDK